MALDATDDDAKSDSSPGANYCVDGVRAFLWEAGGTVVRTIVESLVADDAVGTQ